MERKNNIFDGYFGLERETLRVDERGRLAQTPHPFGDDEHMTRDFCENQTELITPVCSSISQALDSLGELDRKARAVLRERGESIWLYSNPPYFESEDEIPIAAFSGPHSSKRDYREVLQRKYGKALMLFSGIHFNFSFPEELLREWNTGNEDMRSFRDGVYLRLYKQLITHSWLLVLLTAASPYYDESLDSRGKKGIIKSKYASMRNSERGYWNQFLPVLDHSSIQAFTESISFYVKKGMLFSASELYLPIRLKPKGLNSLENLAENGVDHIELRMFDLAPSAPLGIDERSLRFAHLLMLYLLSLPDTELTEEQQQKAVSEHQTAALAAPPHELISRGKAIISDMAAFFGDYPETAEILDFAAKKLESIGSHSSYDIDMILRQAVI